MRGNHFQIEYDIIESHRDDKIQSMKNIKNLYILFKKDVFILKSYIISFLFLYIFFVILFSMILHLPQGAPNEEDIFYYEFALFLVAFVLALSWAGYTPIRSITSEEKERTFKILKGLPLTNYHIFFSKLLLGYILSLALFALPAIIILIHKNLFLCIIPKDIPNEIVNIFTFSGLIKLVFILLFVSTISTCLYLNFKGSQIFIGIEIIMLIFIVGFFIIINVIGKDDYTLSKIFLIPFSQFVKITFLFLPLLIVSCVYISFKLFDKHKSYIKFQ